MSQAQGQSPESLHWLGQAHDSWSRAANSQAHNNRREKLGKRQKQKNPRDLIISKCEPSPQEMEGARAS